MKNTKFMLAASLLVIAAVGTGFYVKVIMPPAVASEEAAAPGAPQAMPVEVAEIKPQFVQIWKNFSGHVVAVDRAEIRPQVSGRIHEIRFEDGQHVEEGDVLMVIDPRPYEAALNQAQASLKSAQAQVDLAEKEYQRAKSLIETEAISQGLLDERTNRRDAAAAAVQGAEAAVKSARINLDYAYVKAPISGKVSRAEITEGNLVQAGGSAPLLTSIVDDERVYVDFEVDERTYISSVKSNATGDADIPVRLVLLDGDTEYRGVVHSFDNRIDPSSGTIRARAIFQNGDKVLLPGMSVSILMGGTGDQSKILVSERAIGTDQDRKFVYTVNGDSVAKYREVKIGESINGQRVILSGLDVGEKVIVEGLVRIRPGMPVSPQMASADVDAPSPDAPPSSEGLEETGEE